MKKNIVIRKIKVNKYKKGVNIKKYPKMIFLVLKKKNF